MKKFKFILFISLLLIQTPAYSDSWYRGGNTIMDMMRAMMQMFTMMNMYQNFSGDSYWSPGYSVTPRLQTLPPIPHQNTGLIDGAWTSDQNTVLITYRGLARFYASASSHQDFYLRIQPGWLQIQSMEDGSVSWFEMRLRGRYMSLWNEDGPEISFIKVADFTNPPYPPDR